MRLAPFTTRTAAAVFTGLLLSASPSSLAAQASGPPPAPPHDSLVAVVLATLDSGNAAPRGQMIAVAMSPAWRASDSTRVDHLLERLRVSGHHFASRRARPSDVTGS